MIIDVSKENAKEREDYSSICNMDDNDSTNRCFECSNFVFPIGCMLGED